MQIIRNAGDRATTFAAQGGTRQRDQEEGSNSFLSEAVGRGGVDLLKIPEFKLFPVTAFYRLLSILRHYDATSQDGASPRGKTMA